MQKKTEYRIIVWNLDNDDDGFSDAVNKMLKHGRTLHGPTQVSYNMVKDCIVLSQAFISL